jgi:hypothetical protein
MEDAEPLRWFSVMLVSLGNTVGKTEVAVVKPIAERKLYEFLPRKDLLHFPAKRAIDPIVVVNVEEASSGQICSEALDLIIRKNNIAMAGEKEHRVRKEPLAREINELVSWINIDVGILLDETQQIDFGRGVVVPVSSTAIFQAGDAELAFDAALSVCRHGKSGQ